jgi:hypothetical protein
MLKTPIKPKPTKPRAVFPDNWEECPTLVLWTEKYAENMYSAALSPEALSLQTSIMGLLFLADTPDIAHCLNAGITSCWFRVPCFAAAYDAIISLPGAGETDIDICAIRDALINADCLGDRPYQFRLVDWIFFAENAISKPIEWYVMRLVGAREQMILDRKYTIGKDFLQ